jgi:hypothetical protein
MLVPALYGLRIAWWLAMGSEWVADRPNILASHSRAQIEQAIALGPIFGRHHHYAGGISANTWAFRTFGPFWAYVSHSKPGDLYQVWSLPDLLARDVALLQIAFDAGADAEASFFLDRSVRAVKTYLDTPFNEFIALYSVAGSDAIDVQLDDIDGYRTFLERVARYRRPGGEIYVFPFTCIEADEYILFQAKYPNAKGEVPIGGPY